MDALLAVIAGQNAIRGFRSRDLTQALPDLSSSQRERLIKRLRTHGIIKKVAYTYKYYLSLFGKRVVAAGLHLKTFVLTPQLCVTGKPLAVSSPPACGRWGANG